MKKNSSNWLANAKETLLINNNLGRFFLFQEKLPFMFLLLLLMKIGSHVLSLVLSDNLSVKLVSYDLVSLPRDDCCLCVNLSVGNSWHLFNVQSKLIIEWVRFTTNHFGHTSNVKSIYVIFCGVRSLYVIFVANLPFSSSLSWTLYLSF